MYHQRVLEQIAAIYQGVAIFSVTEDTPASRAGIRAGDVLIEVHGQRVRRMSDYQTAREGRDGTELEGVVVVRDGREVRCARTCASDAN